MALTHVNKGSRSFWIIFAIFFSLTSVAFVLLAIWPAPRKFNSEDWQQYPSLRPMMIDDLLASRKLKGMSQNEINDLLGKPTGMDSTRESRYIYWAGYSGIDDMWLDIQFLNGRVVGFSMYPD